MDRHIIQWTAPSPLWTELKSTPSGRGVFSAPSILRFATDTFMQDYLDVLATDPRRLGEFRAVPETWRGRLVPPPIVPPGDAFQLTHQRQGNTLHRDSGAGARPTPAFPTGTPVPRLKLYQAAHQRHYLLSACLVCQRTGLPDRTIDPGRQEKVGFVLRRLIADSGHEDDPPESWPEYAWVDGAWVRVVAEERTRNELVLDREERLPLFPARFQEDDLRTRRLFSGVIPVARRDAYLGAPKRDVATTPERPAGTTRKTARKVLFRTDVAEPWKTLITQAAIQRATLDAEPLGDADPPDATQVADAYRASREQTQLVSWLILLDFARFLKEHLPKVHATIHGTPTSSPLTDAESALVTALNQTRVFPGGGGFNHLDQQLKTLSDIKDIATSLSDALKRIPTFEAGLEAATTAYEQSPESPSTEQWPDFLFPLADIEYPHEAPLPPTTAFVPPLSADEEDEIELDSDASALPVGSPTPSNALDRIDSLVVRVVRALPETSSSPEPEISAASIPPVDNRNGLFRIRCVYERPACGPLHLDVVSPPTEVFELAGYFDPDAPARPIRIGLPVDTTPAGLRKFNKNTAFVLSDILCGQVAKIRSITFADLVLSVLPWPFHKDLSVGEMKPCGAGSGGFGTICSLSIPIITLCALILLIIMVTLLDFIFRWLPFLILCFPIPGLKGKK